VTFFPAHFALALRRSRFALLALFCAAVLPAVPGAQEPPKQQEHFYLNDKVSEGLGKIKALNDAKNGDEALAALDALMKTAEPSSYDYAFMCTVKFQFLLAKGDNAQAIEPMETALTLSRQHHYLEESVELDIMQYLAQVYLIESQAKGVKPDQQKLYYSKAAQYAESIIQRNPKLTGDNYFLYAQVLYYWAMATPEKVDTELLKKSQAQIEKALLMTTHPKEQLWVMLNGLLIQQGDYVRSGEIVELLVKQSPNNKTYWQQLQTIYMTLGMNEKDSKKALEYNIRAIVTMERAQALGQLNTPKDNFTLVGTYFNIGQFERVAELLQTGLRNGSIENDQKNWEYLAVAYQQINRETKAIEALKEAETHFPKAGSLHFQIALIYFQLDKSGQAYDEAMKALELGNVEKPGDIYSHLAYWAFELAKYDEALVAANKALEYPEGKKDAQLLRLKGAIQDAIKERDFLKGSPPDQPQQPSAGQKKQPEPGKQPEIKQPKSL
jgi:tetratricopeptide (TPR) repeat protein